ncbi:Gfo/Idh/MocA family oxidoreductase [Micromonospora purpureochromogenes]|uniref:Gfo/Idh/MocA family protein n=1 Tax=Micromonospora purpureochromogenes TaxID=47872 RepID=UPI0033CBADF0
MTSSTLRWALIGASDIAATRVVPAMRALGHRVVGVASNSAERAAAYAAANDLSHATTDVDALVGRDDIDAVYVSSTNEQHPAHVEAVVRAGKHILCEKPLATSMEDATAMVDAAARAGVLLAVNHHLPGADTHREIRRLVRSGAVGRPLAVRVFHAVALPKRLQGWRLGGGPGAGVILDITCHDASVVNPLLDRAAIDAVALSAQQGPWGAQSEDAVVAAIRYADDVLVQTHDAFTVPFAPTGLEVHGDEGSIVATDVMTQDPIGRITLRDRAGAREIELGDRRDLYQIVLDAFAGAVRGEGTPTATGQDGLAALAVAYAVLRSTATGRREAVR